LPRDSFLLILSDKGIISRLTIMKNIIYSIIFLATLAIGAQKTSAATGDLFPYPVPPDSMQMFQP